MFSINCFERKAEKWQNQEVFEPSEGLRVTVAVVIQQNSEKYKGTKHQQ